MPQVFELCSIFVPVYEKRIESNRTILDLKLWLFAIASHFHHQSHNSLHDPPSSTRSLLRTRGIGIIEDPPSYKLDGSRLHRGE
jgi:hypothetical protein